MKRTVKSFLISVACITLLVFAIFASLPRYEYESDVVKSSPDGNYDFVVLRGDASAFSDFSYRIYVVSHGSPIGALKKGEKISYLALWRNSRSLIYEGFNYPMLQWVTKDTIELYLHEVNYSEFYFEPIKEYGEPKKPVLVSLIFNKECNSCVQP